MKIFRIVSIIFTIIWMGIIFSFSSKTAPESSKDSSYIAIKLEEFVDSFYEWNDKYKKDSFINKAEIIIRKGAHFTEYLILSVLVVMSVSPTKKYMTRYIISWIISVLYASSDEVHQLFVAGRSGQLTDVFIDASGALLGVIICIICSYFLTNRSFSYKV